MLIIEFLRYFFGYINFKAYGGLADRFLNLCTKEKIPVWNIKNVNGTIYASTTIDGYFILKSPARKSGMKLCAVEKKGIKYFFRRYKSRVGIVAGALIFAGLITLLSQFVWSVSVVGNVTVEEDVLLSAFENHGVRVGAKISDIDGKNIAQTVVSEMDNLSWAAVNRKGSVVVIEVRESTKAPDIYDGDTPTNLLASEDGIVLSIDILNGKEEVKPGWAVTKGDLLVSGVISHADGKEVLVHADGYVKALVKKNHISSHNDITLYKQSYERSRKVVYFFGIHIPLGKSVPDSYKSQSKTFLKNDTLTLPLGIITEYGAVYSDEKTDMSESLKKKISLFSNACFVKGLVEDSEIRKIITEDVSDSQCIQYRVYVDCKKEIGVLQEIYVEKTDDNT